MVCIFQFILEDPRSILKFLGINKVSHKFVLTSNTITAIMWILHESLKFWDSVVDYYHHTHQFAYAFGTQFVLSTQKLRLDLIESLH